MVEGSSAYMAGLQPGDQVLEIDGQNVSTLSTKALIALAQTLKTVPPSIGVVSRIEQVSLFLLMLITKLTLYMQSRYPCCFKDNSDLSSFSFAFALQKLATTDGHCPRA